MSELSHRETVSVVSSGEAKHFAALTLGQGVHHSVLGGVATTGQSDGLEERGSDGAEGRFNLGAEGLVSSVGSIQARVDDVLVPGSFGNELQ